jgi:predicted small secreted protein
MIAMLAGAALICMGTVGCHTVKGAGQDIQSGGHAIEKAADKEMKK